MRTSETTFSAQDGYINKQDSTFQKREFGSIGTLHGNNQGELSVKPSAFIEVNALIIGVQVEAGLRSEAHQGA